MYCGLMVTGADSFKVTGGQAGSAAFYAADVPMRDREHPGLAFTLAAGRPWQWTGPGGPADATLPDVLAAVSYARITRHPWGGAGGLTAIHDAHQAAAAAAAEAGRRGLAARLRDEQAEVAAPALVSEEIAAKRLGITGKSLNNLRLQYRTICPPVLIAGEVRTRWFWAPGQFSRWEQARPGPGWRKGLTMTYPRVPCPECGRDLAAAGPRGTRPVRRHKRADTREWCPAVPGAHGSTGG